VDSSQGKGIVKKVQRTAFARGDRGKAIREVQNVNVGKKLREKYEKRTSL